MGAKSNVENKKIYKSSRCSQLETHQIEFHYYIYIMYDANPVGKYGQTHQKKGRLTTPFRHKPDPDLLHFSMMVALCVSRPCLGALQ